MIPQTIQEVIKRFGWQEIKKNIGCDSCFTRPGTKTLLGVVHDCPPESARIILYHESVDFDFKKIQQLQQLNIQVHISQKQNIQLIPKPFTFEVLQVIQKYENISQDDLMKIPLFRKSENTQSATIVSVDCGQNVYQYMFTLDILEQTNRIQHEDEDVISARSERFARSEDW